MVALLSFLLVLFGVSNISEISGAVRSTLNEKLVVNQQCMEECLSHGPFLTPIRIYKTFEELVLGATSQRFAWVSVLFTIKWIPENIAIRVEHNKDAGPFINVFFDFKDNLCSIKYAHVADNQGVQINGYSVRSIQLQSIQAEFKVRKNKDQEGYKVHQLQYRLHLMVTLQYISGSTVSHNVEITLKDVADIDKINIVKCVAIGT